MANYNQAVNRKCVIGNTYGTLTVIKFVTEKDLWLCRCICGKEAYRGGNALMKYKIPNCGCQKGKGSLLPNQLSHKRAIISDYKRHAKDRSLDFLLSDEECIVLFNQNCNYCDTPPSNTKTVKPSKKLRNKYACTITTYYYSGIDRVDSSKGYIITNCVSCCYLCNRSKSDLNISDWNKWIKKLYQKTFNDQSKDIESSDSKRETPLGVADEDMI